MNAFTIYSLSKEFSKTAEDIVHPEYSEDELILLSYDIIPIQQQGTSYLNEGEKSKVYRVSYKGQPMVAKITRSQKDMQNLQTLHQLGQHMGELKRHLPIVYQVIEHDDQISSPQYIILVEELKPLNADIKKILLGEEPHQVLSIFLDPHSVSEIMKNILSLADLNQYISPLLYKTIIDELSEFMTHLMRPLTDPQFVKKIYKAKQTKAFAANIAKMFIKGMKTSLPKKIGQDKMSQIMDEHAWNEQVFEQIDVIIYNFVFDLLEQKMRFPSSHERYNKQHVGQYGFSPYDYLPETKSLMHLLHTLKSYGINWYDLQHFNLMERPVTSDVVISDPGNFVLI